MTVAPRQLRRSPRLWALGLLAWFALNALAVVPMPHAVAGAGMAGMVHALHGADSRHAGDACCDTHGQAPCHCAAICAAVALPSVPALAMQDWAPSTMPTRADVDRAPQRDDGPPLRPPLA